MSFVFRSLFAVLLGLNLIPYVLAVTYASCQPGWGWANNSLEQNPCEIAGALEAACQGYSTYALNSLTPGYEYGIPQPNSLGAKCECNTVVYSLYMACTACQNSTVILWSSWEANCDQVYVSLYPYDIPPGTAIPRWAYLNVSVANIFDPVLAQSTGGNPEGLPYTPTVVSLSPTSSLISSFGSNNQVPSSSATNQGSKSSSNAGAIVGGVVGGVALLVIVAGFILVCYRMREGRKNTTSKAPDQQSFRPASRVPSS